MHENGIVPIVKISISLKFHFCRQLCAKSAVNAPSSISNSQNFPRVILLNPLCRNTFHPNLNRALPVLHAVCLSTGVPIVPTLRSDHCPVLVTSWCSLSAASVCLVFTLGAARLCLGTHIWPYCLGRSGLCRTPSVRPPCHAAARRCSVYISWVCLICCWWQASDTPQLRGQSRSLLRRVTHRSKCTRSVFKF